MRRFLEGCGEIGRDHLAADWDATPLGQPEQWPAALGNSVRILLTSRFSMWMAWGPELTFFCNEAYRRDTLGKKYPWALGRPASQVWSEIWPDIGPRIDRVMSTGEATWDESLQLFLERSGYLEETYHTFSYSPLADDDGRIAGMLCVVKEDTEQVISERRMMTLRDLGTRKSGITEAETIASVREALARNPWSLPFTAIYRFDDDGRTAVRAGVTGFDDLHHPAIPQAMSVDDESAPWPVVRLARGESGVVEGLDERFTDLPRGEWPDSPTQALVVPLTQPTQAAPYGFLVVGANRYRPVDDGYHGFVGLIASHLAAAITDARAFELEKKRAESLAQLDQAKTDFFTNVSHEFRTPLTLLLGPTEDALADEEQPLPSRQRERIEVVNRNAQRLLKLVNSLLDFSQLEAGKTISRLEQVDLAGYTGELATMFESAAERAGLELSISCEPLSVHPFVDTEQWAKIVLNLVSNALKFTFEGGITVSLHEDAGDAVLTVRDTGTGIPETELSHLFDRFHRVHGARARTHEGSGIGLALVAELAAQHDGSVDVESTLGEGTTFRVRVPLVPAQIPSVHRRQRGEPAPTAATALAREFVSEAFRWLDDGSTAPAEDDAEVAGPRARVLVVDDNADMRDYVAGLLSGEYDVETAADGLEALERVAARPPDLVLTDVMMPRLDGFGLLEKLHADPATVGLPVVMLSARAGEDGTVEGLEAGADDYLIKPFSARELLARVRVNLELDRNRRVRSALERGRSLLDQAQRLAKVGSWEVDLGSGGVTVSEELLRILECRHEDLEERGFTPTLAAMVHADDRERVLRALEAGRVGATVAFEARLLPPSGDERLVRVRGEVVDSGEGTVLRGSLQDVTEQRQAELALAAATAREQAAAREHAIADELQRTLMPERTFDVEHLDIATYYRAGVQGTQVGGDWYDIIELGGGRTAFVVGDVMGRGVGAAALMGQLRSAIRAFSKLDLPPAELLEHLDSLVHDMAGDQIVTCVYGIFDSTDQCLRYANAGHLPPLLVSPGSPVVRLQGEGPPLGAGYFGMRTEEIPLERGSTVTFYTDGLVERRGRDIDVGIDALARQLEVYAGAALPGLPETLVWELLPDGPDDDVAILVARVDAWPFEAAVSHRLSSDEPAVANARRLVTNHLRDWELPDELVSDVVLMTSELVTNAYVHGRPPIDVRLRRTPSELFVEVQDRAAYRPRRRRARDDDEHGRGLQIVSVLADSWGSRATGAGKSVWFSKSLDAAAG